MPPATSLIPQTLEPTWEIARLFPYQGTWSEAEYLDLETNHLVEFRDGNIEVLPMPTELHQLIVARLWEALTAFIRARNLGLALMAPMRIKLRSGSYREPDIIFMFAQNAVRRRNEYWDGADLVMEVVSPDDARRDYETKRSDYAAAGIAEYWIVDPQRTSISVLSLRGVDYIEHGLFAMNDRASSRILPGFEIDCRSIFVI